MSKQFKTSYTVARGATAAVAPRSVSVARGLFVFAGVMSAAYVWLALIEVEHLTSAARDAAFYAVGVAVVAAVTMLPFAVLTQDARPWARKAMMGTCIALIMSIAALVSVDAATFEASTVVTAWFPVLHFVATALILAAAVGGLIGLAGSATNEYFQRHQQVATDDPRLWSVSQLRNLQQARAAPFAPVLEVAPAPAASSHEPVPAATPWAA